MGDFNCYRIRSSIDGRETLTAGDCVDLRDRDVQEYGPAIYPDFAASLYVLASEPREPRWTPFLRGGFPQGEVSFPLTNFLSALLVVQLTEPSGFFAFSYGSAGRFLLRSGAISRNYGLKASLNLIYPTGIDLQEVDPTRVRSVDSRRIAATTLRTRRQTSRAATFEGFDVDQMRDILRNVTGKPAVDESWGPIVVGGDSLKFSSDIPFRELGLICRRLEEVATRTDYQVGFPWIDDLRTVQDPEEEVQVQGAIVDALRNASSDALELSPPEMIDWSRVTTFQFHFDRRQHIMRPDFDLDYYLAGVDESELSFEFLKSRYLWAVDGNGEDVARWSIWRCITGSAEVNGRHYVIDDGELFQVAPDFLSALDDEISAIPESSVDLPSCDARWKEADYNEAVSDLEPKYLLLDTHIVRGPGFTSGVELCDLLSMDKQLIHVKLKFSSKTLSHLFNQGLVVGESLTLSDFRSAALEVIEQRTTVLGRTTGEHRELIEASAFTPTEWEVVYAIVGRWRGRPLANVLPFFSRITMRHARRELGRLGYKVSFKPVDLVT